jgi:hypothetical protein
MTHLPLAKLQRLLAIGLLGTTLALAWLSIVHPITTYLHERTEQRGISLRALRRNRALVQEAPAVQAALASVEQSARWQNFYVSEKPEAATLQLESDLRAIFKATNNPTSMTAEPATPQGSLTRVAVKVMLSMRVDQLAEALDLLHRQTRHLEIESLSIQAPDLQAADSNPMLMIQAEISGLTVARANGVIREP